MSLTSAFAVAEMPLSKALGIVRAGLPVSAFEQVAEVFGLTVSDLAAKLGVSVRTLNDQKRRRARLSVENSEKLVRAARIHRLARQLFSNDQAVAQWLVMPAPALDGMKPLDLLDTEVGSREVEDVLTAMSHGVYL